MRLWPFSRRSPAGTRLVASSAASKGRDQFLYDDLDSEGNSKGTYQGRSSSDDSDATAAERDRARRASRRLYRQSGIYGQMIDIYVSWVVGDGVMIKADDEKADEHLQAILNSRTARFHRKLPGWIRRAYRDGELPLTITNVVRTPSAETKDGKMVPAAESVAFGYMLPETIHEIETLAVDHGTVTALTVKRGLADEVKYPIADVGRPPRENEDRRTATAVAFWRVNVIEVRGLPLFSRTLDKAAMLDQTVEQIARKAEYTNRFWIVATYTPSGDRGQDKDLEKEIRDWVKTARSGEVACFPTGFKLEFTAPNLAMPDFKELYEILVDWILGSHGIPRMWFSSGGDTNRATAVEQGTPIARQLRNHQAEVQGWLEDLARYLIYLGKLSGAVPQGASEDVEVVMSDAASRDSVRDVDELSRLILALNEYAAAKAISPLERQKIARKVLSSKWYGDQLEEDAPELEEDGDKAVVLNGAQLGVLQAAVADVAQGKLPKESAVEMLVALFQVERETAESMLAPAEEFGSDVKKAQEEAAKRAHDLLKAERGRQSGKTLPAAKPIGRLAESLSRLLPSHRRPFRTLPDGRRQLKVPIAREAFERIGV